MNWFKRDWTQIQPNTFRGRLLRMPLALVPRHLPLSILSGFCKGMKWTLESNIYSYWFGTYELEKQGALSRYLRPGMIVYDVGANAGFYTLLFSKSVGEKGHVYSFEPYPENTNHLLRHIALNGLKNVTVINAAITNIEKLASFHIAANNSSGFVSNNGALLNVPTLSMDKFIKDGYPPPDLIKMDIEGGEIQALEGAKDVLVNTRAIWFIALHNNEARRRCGEMLRSADYQTFHMDGRPAISLSDETDEIYALPPKFKPAFSTAGQVAL